MDAVERFPQTTVCLIPTDQQTRLSHGVTTMCVPPAKSGRVPIDINEMMK